MRINQMYASNMRVANQMNNNNHKIQESTKRLSTGKAIQNPSDYGKIGKLESSIRQKGVEQKQFREKHSFLDTVENVLVTGQGIGLRLKELSTQYQSETISKDEKKAINKEVTALSKELKTIFESATFNGKKIFDKKGSDSILSKLELDITDMGFIQKLTDKLGIGKIYESVTKPLGMTVLSADEVKPRLATRTLATNAYQKSMETMRAENSEKDLEQASMPMALNSTSTYSDNFVSNMVTKAMEDIFEGHEEVLNYLKSKKPEAIYKELKANSYEALESLAKEYGYEKEFKIADKLGILKLMGIEKKKETQIPETPQPEPSNPDNNSSEQKPPIGNDTVTPPETKPETDNGTKPDKPTVPDEGTIGNGETTNKPPTTDGNEQGTGNTDKPGNNGTTGSNSGNGGINIGIGNNQGNIDIDIDIDIDIKLPVGDVVGGVIDAVEDVTDEILNEFDDWFKPDFVDDEILDTIDKALVDVQIKNRILEFREGFESRLKEIEEERLAQLQDVDISKELAEKAKNTMLEQMNAYLFKTNINQQQRLFDMLF